MKPNDKECDISGQTHLQCECQDQMLQERSSIQQRVSMWKKKKSERINKQQTQGTLEVLIYDENFKTFRRIIENNFLITGLGNYFLDMTTKAKIKKLN